MCWICDKDQALSGLTGKPAFGLHFAPRLEAPIAGLELFVADLGLSHMRGEAWIGGLDGEKFADGMIGTGHQLAPPQIAPLLIGIDTVPGDTSTTATLTVDAPSTISTTDTPGDLDFYKVQLVAGQTYEIGMYGKDGGPNALAQPDSYIEIYGADGALIVSADGGAPTLRNNINTGLDVLLTFTPDVSGTYHINARAFDQDPTDGTNGETVGDYELFVRSPIDPYRPYYDVDSPLYAIDWGSQVDRTSRNPDGQEGPRVTGNEFTGVGSNPFGIAGKNVITYYFARQGEVFVSNDPVGDPVNGALTTTVAYGMENWEKGACSPSAPMAQI